LQSASSPFSKACDLAAEKLGGYKRIDDAVDPLWDALLHNPLGFENVETGLWFSARFATTKPFGRVPALAWIVLVDEDGDVTIDHVEEYEGY
jgi:hypothetical protein